MEICGHIYPSSIVRGIIKNIFNITVLLFIPKEKNVINEIFHRHFLISTLKVKSQKY